jgi:hypothetical protein
MVVLFSRGGDVQSSKWDGRSGHRLHVSDLAAGISRREIERVFGKYGSLNEVSLRFISMIL